MTGETMTMRPQKVQIRTIAVTGMLGALATILMFLEFPVPMIMPPFIKFDFSELPALLAAYAMGPVSGIAVCFIKNAINLLHTQTGGVGELSNFILGVCFVLPAGLIYKKKKTQKRALLGALLGAVLMAVISVFSNYFIVYPVYTNFMSMDAILKAYRVINGNVSNLWDALIWFNMPFTFVKGLCSVLITFLIYKRVSPILKGTNR
ncbi:ECF transporter S component [Anaerostipes sp. MSJ-23]|uniref:ECF transporter S component n=2 Tax=unclassified Anaerostipes TaxID=2635253 RepID=UPI001C127946|nr:ECF transporter S component [Anaerostipes sp. MSJ-23]MBU5459105.1 ECF transporter S component [Anaerostipes sp. MSJ-23]